MEATQAWAHLDTTTKSTGTERGCVRSSSRSDWRERHLEVVSPRLRIRGCCGWSFGQSRAPGSAEMRSLIFDMSGHSSYAVAGNPVHQADSNGAHRRETQF